MLSGLISPVSELILKAKCLGDWEMVAMEVQADLWQLSKETEHRVLAGLGCLRGCLLMASKDQMTWQTPARRLLSCACVVCQKRKLGLRGVD